MTNVTFTATFTFPKESVQGFAQFIGYVDTIKQPVLHEDGTISHYVDAPNPQSAFDFICVKAKEHNEQFCSGWAHYLVQQAIDTQTAQLRPQLEEQILKPVKDAVVLTYSENGDVQ